MPANPHDSVYCIRLAHNAVHAAMSGRTEMVVGRWHGRFVHVPMALAIRERNTVDPARRPLDVASSNRPASHASSAERGAVVRTRLVDDRRGSVLGIPSLPDARASRGVPFCAAAAWLDRASNMSNHDLLRKLNDAPFKPFRLKLSNSTAIDVLEPGSVIVGDTSAVLPVDEYRDEQGFRIIRRTWLNRSPNGPA